MHKTVILDSAWVVNTLSMRRRVAGIDVRVDEIQGSDELANRLLSTVRSAPRYRSLSRQQLVEMDADTIRKFFDQ